MAPNSLTQNRYEQVEQKVGGRELWMRRVRRRRRVKGRGEGKNRRRKERRGEKRGGKTRKGKG